MVREKFQVPGKVGEFYLEIGKIDILKKIDEMWQPCIICPLVLRFGLKIRSLTNIHPTVFLTAKSSDLSTDPLHTLPLADNFDAYFFAGVHG